jgi:phosphoribosylanthranilate isomerase
MLKPGSVKICSLREVEQVPWVIEAAPDMFGLIFVESAWRMVTPQMGKAIVDEFDALAGPNRPKAVGVFLDSPPSEINRIADRVGLDFVQVHTHDMPIDWKRFELPVLPVLRPQPDVDLPTITATIDSILGSGANIPAILIDAWHPDTIGGAGVLGNWSIARELATRYPIVLAGGLTPSNVGEAITEISPVGVDVSSGVETARIKDPAKLKAFVASAREAFGTGLLGQVD